MRSEDFKYAVRETLEKEGVFSDHAQDPGGRTKYGITSASWRKYQAKRPHLPADVAAIDVEQAKDFYHEEFWRKLQLDLVGDRFVAAEIFDSAVNCGPSRGVRFIQAAYNYVRPRKWPALVEDGKMGKNTRGGIHRSINAGLRVPLLLAANGEQYGYYKGLAEASDQGRTKWDFRSFTRGWTRRLEMALRFEYDG